MHYYYIYYSRCKGEHFSVHNTTNSHYARAEDKFCALGISTEYVGEAQTDPPAQARVING